MRFEPVDYTSVEFPFEQVWWQIVAQVGAGMFTFGTRLLTVRVLVVDIGFAVNTVARVYRELEVDGVVVIEGRRGTFVSFSSAAFEVDVSAAVSAYVEVARRAGFGVMEVKLLVERQWACYFWGVTGL